jgi:hypothetical protein
MTGQMGPALLPSDLTNQLAFPRSAVINRIREAVDRGWALLNAPADGPVAFNTFRANRSKWDDNNRDMLRRLFKTDAARLTYDKTGVVPQGASTPALELERLRASVEHRLSLLQTMLDRLGGAEDGGGGSGARPGAVGAKPIVFIAHAGDIGLAKTVGRFLDSQRISPVIVTDTPGEGEIGVGQVDGYPDARFAIVLVGGGERGSGGDGTRPQPNPDAMMWLGYFTGRLGRRRVCGLIQQGLDHPARQFGVKSYNYDEGGGWKAMVNKAIEIAEGGE